MNSIEELIVPKTNIVLKLEMNLILSRTTE